MYADGHERIVGVGLMEQIGELCSREANLRYIKRIIRDACPIHLVLRGSYRILKVAYDTDN
jgi:hypothetical protein